MTKAPVLNQDGSRAMKKILPKSARNPQGFTLIELMVVITIIAVLSLIGIVAFTSVQKNARDARRRGDVDAIANALEANKGMNGDTYSTLTDSMFASGHIATESASFKEKYCLYENDDSTTPPTPAAPWSNSACPDANWHVIDNTQPTAAAKAWTICAKLESGQVYCRQSAQ